MGGSPSSVQAALQRAIGYVTATPDPGPTLPQAPQPVAAASMSGGGSTPQFGAPVGPGGDTLGQLRAGFAAAGRQDLANMVGTPAFNAWINAESGGRANAVSKANNHGMPNGGIFQFWYGHEWAKPFFQGGQFTMSPYQQAQYAAKYFHLTPAHIQQYAQQIASHTYRGWG